MHICDVAAEAVQAAVQAHAGLSGSVTDVADEAQVLAMFAELAERWGKLDALVNNAGVSGPTSRLEDTDLAAWQATLDVNLTGTFCARSAVPLLREAGGGAIINISSVAGRLGFRCAAPTAPANSDWRG